MEVNLKQIWIFFLTFIYIYYTTYFVFYFIQSDNM